MLRLKTQATSEPVTLAEVKAYLNIDVTDWDDKLTTAITSARMQIEKLTGLSLAAVTYEYEVQDYDELYIDLPYPKCGSVSSVKETDSAGTVSTLTYTLVGNRVHCTGSGGMLVVTYTTAAPVDNEFFNTMILKQVRYDYRNAFEPKGIDDEVLRMSRLVTINFGI